jgi:hypothetical protein
MGDKKGKRNERNGENSWGSGMNEEKKGRKKRVKE